MVERYPMTGGYAPTATCKHGVHPYDCREGCDPHEHARYDHLHERIRELEAAHRIDMESLMAKSALIGELEAIVRRFVAFDPYPDSALTKEARALLAAGREGEHE